MGFLHSLVPVVVSTRKRKERGKQIEASVVRYEEVRGTVSYDEKGGVQNPNRRLLSALCLRENTFQSPIDTALHGSLLTLDKVSPEFCLWAAL